MLIHIRPNRRYSQRLLGTDPNLDVYLIVAFDILLFFLVKIQVLHDLVRQLVVSLHAKQVVAVKQVDSYTFYRQFLVWGSYFLYWFYYLLCQLVYLIVNPLLHFSVLPQVNEVQRWFQQQVPEPIVLNELVKIRSLTLVMLNPQMIKQLLLNLPYQDPRQHIHAWTSPLQRVKDLSALHVLLHLIKC